MNHGIFFLIYTKVFTTNNHKTMSSIENMENYLREYYKLEIYLNLY